MLRIKPQPDIFSREIARVMQSEENRDKVYGNGRRESRFRKLVDLLSLSCSVGGIVLLPSSPTSLPAAMWSRRFRLDEGCLQSRKRHHVCLPAKVQGESFIVPVLVCDLVRARVLRGEAGFSESVVSNIHEFGGAQRTVR